MTEASLLQRYLLPPNMSAMTTTVEPRVVRKLSAHTGAIRLRSDSREVVCTPLEMSTLRVPRYIHWLSLSW